MQTTLTYHELRCLVAHASKDETRLHLNSVCFDSAKGVVASTDGHRLALRMSEPFGDSPALFPLRAMTLVMRCMSYGDTVEVTERLATVNDRDGNPLVTVPLEASDALFPPYHCVIPGGATKQEPVVVAADAKFVRHAVGHLAKISGSKTRQVHVRTFGELDPIEFTTRTGDGTWAIIVMPQRSLIDETLGNVIGERLREKPKAKTEQKPPKVAAKTKAPSRTKKPTRKGRKAA